MSNLAPESDWPIHVLFLCTGNSARSILAEVILNRLGGVRWIASSAGSQPKSEPHALTLETLKRLDYETQGLRSKSWDEFARPESPRLDFIVTVCANAAGESCPIWLGRPISAHWGLEDPAAFQGSRQEKCAFFEEIHDALRTKIGRLVDLDAPSFGGPANSADHRRDRVARIAAEIGLS
jgi:protein-tyrosine-phosphatase